MAGVAKVVSFVRPFLLLAAILLASGGCKKPADAPVKVHQPPPPPANVKGSVEGRITYHGVGLASGYVQIIGPDGTSAEGAIQMGGTYTVWDPPHGRVRFAVMSQPPAGLSKAPPAKHTGTHLPERYADPDTSGITLDFGGGRQKFDIVLTD
jgi:hypothetical protein